MLFRSEPEKNVQMNLFDMLSTQPEVNPSTVTTPENQDVQSEEANNNEEKIA